MSKAAESTPTEPEHSGTVAHPTVDRRVTIDSLTSRSLAHAMSVEAVLNTLDVDSEQGLTQPTVERRRIEFGDNQLTHVVGPTPLQLVLAQFRNPVVYLLSTAALLALILGDVVEAVAILIVLVINAIIGFVTEWRARRSMDALRDLSIHEVTIRRSGQVMTRPASELVPGDIVIVDAGNVLAADMRVLSAAGLTSNESALTGESVPSVKTPDTVDADNPLADRSNMLYKGCAVSSGTGEAVVVATGMQSELGKVTQLVASSDAARSPLEDQLSSLSRDLMLFTLLVTTLVAVAGWLGGRDLNLMVQSAVALAVATIPEGLPIVATLALARGMSRMARHHALIEQLSAVETLGATTLILTDKTGTLTENRMQLAAISILGHDYQVDPSTPGPTFLTPIASTHTPGRPTTTDERNPALDHLFLSVALCNNASLASGENEASGDPMEIALLEAATLYGHDKATLLDRYPEVRELAFDSTTRRMATIHRRCDDEAVRDHHRSFAGVNTDPTDDHGRRSTEGYFVAVKGAPEAVLENADSVMGETGISPLCVAERAAWFEKSDELAGNGLRVLAIAGTHLEAVDQQRAFEALTLYALVGFRDPPRSDIADTIRVMHQAGVGVVMVTGDHVETARCIAQQIGMIGSTADVLDGRTLSQMNPLDERESDRLRHVRVFSRVSPEQKLQLITLHQNAGDIVGMLGDGINDAPALQKADIGVAMGNRGTQVAKDAADMVLRDDKFSTLVHAIREGRLIFTNIRRFSVYLLSCNLSEILVVGIAVLANLPLPLLPLQILFLNLVTDVFPAFALGTIAAGRDVLERPPRPPSEKILGSKQWRTIALNGSSICVATLLGMTVSTSLLSLEDHAVTTLCFYTLALAQLWLAFAMHNWREHLFTGQVILNRTVWLAVALCLLILFAAARVPVVSSALQFESLPLAGWFWILGLSLMPLLARELVTGALRRLKADSVKHHGRSDVMSSDRKG